MNEKVNAVEVLRILEAIVASAPEGYRYKYIEIENDEGDVVPTNTCMYTDSNGEPSCIVGHVLSRVAPDLLEKVNAIEWEITIYPVSTSVRNIENQWHLPLQDYFTEGAVKVMTLAQGQQDVGETWENALNQAKLEASYQAEV